MLTIITAGNAGAIPVRTRSAMWRLSSNWCPSSLRKVCGECGHRDDRSSKIWFCSPKCLLDFIAAGRLEHEVGVANGTIDPWAGLNIDPTNKSDG